MSAYYNCYDLKTNTTANNWSDLVNLCYEIYATDTTEFRDSLEAIFNTPTFIGSWAACNLFVDFRHGQAIDDDNYFWRQSIYT